MAGLSITLTTILGLFGLGVAFFYMNKIKAIPLDMGLEGKDAERLRYIHGAIAKGAMAFLKNTDFLPCS